MSTDLTGLPGLKPRPLVHPDRMGGFREWIDPIQGVCIHDTEGGEGLSSAEGIAHLVTLSKVQAAGNFAAYHYVVDADSIIPLAFEAFEPYAQGGANDALISACITGKAAQTPDQWADAMSKPALVNLARLVARIVVAHDVPIRKINGEQLRAGERGICGHVDVRDAYHKTTHADPGPSFPWGWFIAEVRRFAHPERADPQPAPQPTPQPIPQEDDDMATHTWRDERYTNVFVEPQGSTVGAEEVDQYAKLPRVEETHDQKLASCVWRAWGLSADAHGGPAELIAAAVQLELLVPA